MRTGQPQDAAAFEQRPQAFAGRLRRAVRGQQVGHGRAVLTPGWHRDRRSYAPPLPPAVPGRARLAGFAAGAWLPGAAPDGRGTWLRAAAGPRRAGAGGRSGWAPPGWATGGRRGGGLAARWGAGMCEGEGVGEGGLVRVMVVAREGWLLDAFNLGPQRIDARVGGHCVLIVVGRQAPEDQR